MTDMGPKFPHTVETDHGEIVIRPMTASDEAAVLAFAKNLPQHDLLFLPRDISNQKVLQAWIKEVDDGGMRSLLAFRGDKVVGCGALVLDPHSWSPHVCELRMVVSTEAHPVSASGVRCCTIASNWRLR